MIYNHYIKAKFGLLRFFSFAAMATFMILAPNPIIGFETFNIKTLFLKMKLTDSSLPASLFQHMSHPNSP